MPQEVTRIRRVRAELGYTINVRLFGLLVRTTARPIGISRLAPLPLSHVKIEQTTAPLTHKLVLRFTALDYEFVRHTSQLGS